MKSKRLLILLLMALLVPWAANAQTVTIGDGTSTDYYSPIGTFHNYSFSEQLYTPTEINQTGYIVSIAFDYAGTVFDKDFPIVVYMKAVDNQNLSDGMISLAATDEVFNGTLSVTAAGWATINLDKAFSYDGTKNLLIAVDKQYLKWYSNGNWNHTAASNMTRSIVDDNTNTDPLTMSASTGTVRANRPNVQLTFGTPSTCVKPTLLEAALTPNDGTIATLKWIENGASTEWTLQYGTDADFAAGTFTEMTQGFVTGDTITANLTGLTPDQKLYARVKPNCEPDNPKWSGVISFTPSNYSMVVVNDGTTTNSFIPIYYYYVYYSGYQIRSQFITPATTEELANVKWGTINKLVFYNNNASVNYGDAEFAVYVAEVPETTMSEFFDWATLTNVYTGTVSVSDNEMEITFSTPFHYMGGNLLVGFNRTATGTSPSSNTWVGKNGTSGCSRYFASSESPSSFLPKMKICYTPGEEPDCLPVSALAVTEAEVTSTEIPITWTGHNETSWNIRWRKYGTTDTYSTATSTTPSYTITGLTGNTKYEFGVQAGCDEDDIWTSGSYTTACGIETSIHEKFDSYTGTTSGSTNNLPHCWDYYNGTTYSYGAGYPLIYNGYAYSGSNSLRFYSYYSSSYTYTDQYAILPAVVNVSAMRISLYASLYTSYSYGYTTTYPGELVVGVMTDDDLTTFTAVDTIKPTSSYKPFTVNLDSYTGTGNRIALKMTPATSSQTNRCVMVDNLVVEVIPDCETPTGLALKSDSQTPEGATIVWNPGNTSSWFVEYKKNSESEYTAIETPVADTFYTFMGLDANTSYNARIKVNCTTGTGITYPTDPVSFTTAKACPAPKNLVVSNVTGTSATLAWTPGYNETEWTVKYKVSDSATYITAPTVSGTPTINLTGLGSGTTYDVQIIGCDVANVYTVTRAFTTAFTAPYLQAFAASSIPAGWNNYSTLLAPEVLNGTTPLSGSGNWIFSNTNVFGAYHAKLNIFGEYCKSWLLTPNIVVGSGQVLSFDLALTVYSYETPIEDTTAQSDDKFIVLVSTNNGTTWSILRQWNNAGSEYVYNRIATTGETVYIDLAGFSGQTVRIAFYGESTIGNGDNDLHIDNVSIDLPPTCYRPLGLTASDVTNHSAKLSWTAGTEDQTAWQIAYRKGTTFNPADTTLDWTTVTTVDVTTNPYTFVKTLDPASTYYMYVRANCGDGDYSEWCRKVCSFTTEAAAPAPTNFQKTDVGPDFAKLTWKAGGGDFLANYDLYVVQSATTPAMPTIDTVPTIAGITELPTAENPYLLEGLDNEKRYYVWVRANHVHPDTTMHSAWVAISDNYFTTLVACPTPTTKPVTNLQPYSATLNWTGYSESYNVQYRTAAITNYSEDFSGQTPVEYYSPDGQLPEGWHSFNSSSSGYAPRVSNKSNYSYISMTGNYLLMTTNDSDQSTYAIMPQIEGIDSVAFKYIYESTSKGTFTVGYVTNNTGYSTYVPLQTPTKTNTVSTYTLTADDITTINNANGYIAFRYVSGSSTFYSVGVDDIFVKVSNAIPAGEWIAANNGESIEGTTVAIAELADNTKYEWQVQATCANDWSASAYFTTPWACSAPVVDSVNSITYNSAKLYWTGYQENYNVRYRTAEDADIFLQTGLAEDDYYYDWYFWSMLNSGSNSGFYYIDQAHTQICYAFKPDQLITGSQYLISYEMDSVYEGTNMSFLTLNDTIPSNMKIGFSSTTGDTTSFAWLPEMAISTFGYKQVAVPTGTKYVAFQYISGGNIGIADVTVFANYVAPGEWQYANNVTSPATITGLEDERWYEWQVQGNNTVCTGDTTAWSANDFFQTKKAYRQTVELAEGWNWFSTYIDVEDNNIFDQLKAGLGTSGLQISSLGNGASTYRNGKWFGSVTIKNESGYKIKTSAPVTFTIIGSQYADPAECPITINKSGWSWIGYPVSESQTLATALAEFQASNQDQIKTAGGGATYRAGKWLPVTYTLVPGKSYAYKSNASENKTLVFPNVESTAKSDPAKSTPNKQVKPFRAMNEVPLFEKGFLGKPIGKQQIKHNQFNNNLKIK